MVSWKSWKKILNDNSSHQWLAGAQLIYPWQPSSDLPFLLRVILGCDVTIPWGLRGSPIVLDHISDSSFQHWWSFSIGSIQGVWHCCRPLGWVLLQMHSLMHQLLSGMVFLDQASIVPGRLWISSSGCQSVSNCLTLALDVWMKDKETTIYESATNYRYNTS